MHITETLSPNFDRRTTGAYPMFIVLHYTGTHTLQDALDVYLNADQQQNHGRVSPHYVVAQDGAIIRTVEESARAWHAGKAYWKGLTDLNSWSIGIELVNEGHPGGLPSYPAPQIEALTDLCRDIMARHTMRSCDVLGHSDISVTRKIDPGEHFPWETLARAGIGLWPQPSAADRQAGEDARELDPLIRGMLTGLGYAPDLPLSEVIAAFQRRYHPGMHGKNGAPGLADPDTLARLICLYRLFPDMEDGPVGRMTALRLG